MLLQHSPQCYLSGPQRRLAQCNNRILDIQQAAQWLHSNPIPLTIPQGSTYLRTLWHQRAYLTMRDGILYRHWKDVPGGGTQPRLQLLLPPNIVPEVLQKLHSSPTGGHLGISKTLEKARARFYWPRQRYDVRDWCNRCEICSSRKSPIPKSCPPLQLQLADGDGYTGSN